VIPSWTIWTFVALVCWGLWALMSKLIGDALSPEASQALSTLGMLPVMLGLALARKPASIGKTKLGAWLGFAAGALTCIGNIAYYALLNSGEKVVAVVPLTALYPLVTILLAVVFLKEKLNRIQLFGTVLALVAIWIFNVPPESARVSSLLLVAMIPIAFWGISGLLQKVSTNHISGELSTVCFLAAFLPVAAILLLRGANISNVSSRAWLLVLLLGLTFAFGNFAILQAFARGGKASIIAPVAGLYPIVSIPIAVAALGEKVSSRELFGILTALAAVAAISMESKTAKE
jgi:uncharacterized membrane protein